MWVYVGFFKEARYVLRRNDLQDILSQKNKAQNCVYGTV